MGGISVLVVLGLFMSFYAVYLFLIFISIFYLVENYIFESLFLYNKTHSKKSWIPYYSKYLLGKEVALEKEGLFLMMIEIMGTILFYLSLNVQLGSLDTIIFLLFLFRSKYSRMTLLLFTTSRMPSAPSGLYSSFNGASLFPLDS